MPATTPVYGLPYPLPGDPIADGANTVKALAEATEVAIATGGGGGGGGGGGLVTSVNGKTGTVELDHEDVGAAPASHTHTIANVTGLQTALDGKAASSHTHTAADVGAAPASHTHTIANVTGLQTALDGKAPGAHTHTPADVGAVANGGGVAAIKAVTTMPTTTDPNTIYVVRP